MTSPRWKERLRALRRTLSWHRRLIAAGLVAAAVVIGLEALQPAPPVTTTVLVAASDLPAGRELRAADVRPREVPPQVAPSGALRPGFAINGRLLTAPVRAGEPLTDVRLLGRSMVRAYGRTTVAAPVRIADAGVLTAVRPGDRVDILAASTSAEPGEAQRAPDLVARAAPVIALPRGRAADPTLISAPGDGGLLLLAVSPAVAANLARAAVTSRLSLVLHGS